MIITRDEVAALLNWNYMKGYVPVRVRYPFYNCDLYSYDPGNFTLRDIAGDREIERQRRKHEAGHFLRRDLPTHYDLQDAFVCSGVARFLTEKDVLKKYREIMDEVRDPFFRPKAPFIAIDTNVAYYRGISRHFPYLTSLPFIVSGIVVQEIDSRIHEKYSPKYLAEYVREFGHRDIIGEFSNGSVKASRRAKIALSEIWYIMNHARCMRTETTTDVEDKEERDRLIAEDYREVADKWGVEVILLTADRDMAFHANAAGISSIPLRLPVDLRERVVSFERATDLIYTTAYIFGAVEVNGVHLLGVWRGKGSEDAFDERMLMLDATANLTKVIKELRAVEVAIGELQEEESERLEGNA